MTPTLKPFDLLAPLPQRAAAWFARAALATLGSCLTLLLGACGDKPYTQRDGQWLYDGTAVPTAPGSGFKPLAGPFARDALVGYYRGTPVVGSHGRSFRPLDDHYAQDQTRAYFCDTYRKGQEYYTIKHSHILAMEGVSLASFRLLGQGYARDDHRLYYEGLHFAVADLVTFQVLPDADYQRDRMAAYYKRRAIPGSDGSSFAVLGGGYAKDRSSVYFSHYRSTDPALRDKTIRVVGAAPDTLAVKAGGYAVDAGQAYHNGLVLSKDAAGFAWLGSLYAKTTTAVYFDGRLIPGADAATFTVLESKEADADAKDARWHYRQGERVTSAAPAR